MKKLILISTFAVMLAACGGSDDYKPAAALPTAPAPVPPAPAPAADAFVARVEAAAATMPDDAEAANIDAVVMTTPDDSEPKSL